MTILCLFVCWSSLVAAAETAVRVEGRVVKKGTENGIGGVVVQLNELKLTTDTDEHGKFILDRVPPGTYSVVLSLGDENAVQQLVIAEGGSADVKLEVDWAVRGYEAVTVVAEELAAKVVDAPAAITSIPAKQIEQQASLTYDALKLLVDYLESGNSDIAEQLSLKEKEADEVRRILIDELNRTFVTPFDREDIFALSRSIDDVVDYADSTVIEMVILKVGPTPYMLRIASLLKDAAYEIWHGVQRLPKHPNVAIDHAQRAKALENRVEAVYREAVADLFSGPEDLHHVVEMLKLREVYRHLSNAADRGDEAANTIADIVVKRT